MLGKLACVEPWWNQNCIPIIPHENSLTTWYLSTYQSKLGQEQEHRSMDLAGMPAMSLSFDMDPYPEVPQGDVPGAMASSSGDVPKDQCHGDTGPLPSDSELFGTDPEPEQNEPHAGEKHDDVETPGEKHDDVENRHDDGAAADPPTDESKPSKTKKRVFLKDLTPNSKEVEIERRKQAKRDQSNVWHAKWESKGVPKESNKSEPEPSTESTVPNPEPEVEDVEFKVSPELLEVAVTSDMRTVRSNYMAQYIAWKEVQCPDVDPSTFRSEANRHWMESELRCQLMAGRKKQQYWLVLALDSVRWIYDGSMNLPQWHAGKLNKIELLSGLGSTSLKDQLVPNTHWESYSTNSIRTRKDYQDWVSVFPLSINCPFAPGGCPERQLHIPIHAALSLAGKPVVRYFVSYIIIYYYYICFMCIA